MFEHVTCPHCDADPTNVEEAERKAHLKNLGYLHRDIELECPNGHSWWHGVPEGTPATAPDWTCDACGASYSVRDVALGVDGKLHVVVKCEDCFYKPPRALRYDIPEEDTGNNEWRVLLGDPKVCGNTEDAEPHRARMTIR